VLVEDLSGIDHFLATRLGDEVGTDVLNLMHCPEVRPVWSGLQNTRQMGDELPVSCFYFFSGHCREEGLAGVSHLEGHVLKEVSDTSSFVGLVTTARANENPDTGGDTWSILGDNLQAAREGGELGAARGKGSATAESRMIKGAAVAVGTSLERRIRR